MIFMTFLQNHRVKENIPLIMLSGMLVNVFFTSISLIQFFVFVFYIKVGFHSGHYQ